MLGQYACQKVVSTYELVTCTFKQLTASVVPSDYDELLSQYTHKGFRVIACAAKHKQKLNWVRIQKMSRTEAESGLEFLGFIIFENKLKPSTSGVIAELNRAGLHSVMCTGDNILTAVSVSRECGLLEQGEQCFIPYFIEGWFSSFTGSIVA